MATEWIARSEFDFLPSTGGDRRRVTLGIGRPYRVPISNRGHTYSRCPIALDPIIPLSWVAGDDEWQALSLTVEFVRTLMRLYLAEGGTIYFPGSESRVLIDDWSFVTTASFDRLVAGANDRATWGDPNPQDGDESG